MSDLSQSTTSTPAKKIQHGRRLMEEPSGWMDIWTVKIADWCSPILVKEARQALKSRQFQWTFLLLLLFVVVWSFLGVTFSLRTSVEENGPQMLVGYLWIIGFPLAVVIPLAAFRSLAREYEDETIQLVSITTMSARRIILGKLGSALLQIMLYAAAVTPCIVFSYILRGISFSMIWMGCSLAISGSIGLTCLGLMVAGACRNVVLRVAANLFLLVGLLGAFFMWCMFTGEVLLEFTPDEVLLVANVVSLMFLTCAYLFVESAASLISFHAENRSRRVRVALLVVPFVCFAGIMAASNPYGVPITILAFVLSVIGSHYFTIIGAMTASERSGISNRVRRELPKTWFGRAIGGLFYPGPGRGYLFGLLGLLTVNLMAGLMFLTRGALDGFLEIQSGINTGGPTGFETFWVIVINTIFGMGYLSFVYLTMLLLERYAGPVKVFIGLLLGGIVYALLAIASFTIHETVFASPYDSYRNYVSPAYYINWPVMISYSDSRVAGEELLMFTLFVGGPVLLLTLWAYLYSIRELVVSAAAIPERLQQELQKPEPRKSIPSGETFEEIFQQRHTVRIESDQIEPLKMDPGQVDSEEK